jgi:integrase
MMAAGSSAGTAHQAHRTVRTALGEAVRRGHLLNNPATLANAPRLSETEVEPFSIENVQRILAVAGERRNGARWAVALALGLRQGEALGLRWSDVDLDAGTLAVRRSRNRPRYEHGCGGTCGKDHAGHCPSRRQVRADTGDTKSANGRRVVGLPAELVKLLRAHRDSQDRDRQLAAQLWQEGGWVFTSPTGQPINPSTDYHGWKRLIRAVGLPEARLHDARHTAATVLLVLGVPERAVMSLMGWADTGMAKRYQHVTDQVRLDIAGRVGGLLWSAGGGKRT